jgi:hypothetical protein
MQVNRLFGHGSDLTNFQVVPLAPGEPDGAGEPDGEADPDGAVEPEALGDPPALGDGAVEGLTEPDAEADGAPGEAAPEADGAGS